jgi:HAMP domain-containing protein
VDVETTLAIERLTERIDALEISVHGDMKGLRGEVGDLRGEVGELRGEVGELRGEVGELRGEIGNLRAEMREGLEEVRRQAKALIEETNETLRLVAGGVAHLSVKIDSLAR